MTTDLDQKCRKCETSILPTAIRCPACGKLSSRGDRLMSLVVVSALIVASLIAFAILNSPAA